MGPSAEAGLASFVHKRRRGQRRGDGRGSLPLIGSRKYWTCDEARRHRFTNTGQQLENSSARATQRFFEHERGIRIALVLQGAAEVVSSTTPFSITTVRVGTHNHFCVEASISMSCRRFDGAPPTSYQVYASQPLRGSHPYGNGEHR